MVVGEDYMTVQKRLVERNRGMAENRVERADHITECGGALCIVVLAKVAVLTHYIFHGLPPIVYTYADGVLTVLIVGVIAAGLYDLRVTAHTHLWFRLSITAAAVTLAILTGAFLWTMWD